jgi:ABC-2 type transport system permease protein
MTPDRGAPSQSDPSLSEFVLDGASNGAAAPVVRLGGPIADLSYRNYDGPLHTRVVRWWIIAISRVRYLRARWWFWLFVALSVLPWLFTAIIMYFQSQTGGVAVNNPFFDSTVGQKYASHFFRTLGWQGFWLFCIALMTGAGAISSDNRSNALLVYLSKPITKGDYLLGKWMSTFLMVFSVAFVPALLFYLYCLLSYYSDGFLKEEPWLLLRIIGACAVPAAIHASLLTGTSAWSKTPVLAGATYAGIYFVSSIVALAIWGIRYRGDFTEGVLLRHLSISGVIDGLTQNIFGVTLHMGAFRRHAGMQQLTLHPPSFWAVLAIGLGLCAVGVIAARMRIRAVEVVSG